MGITRLFTAIVLFSILAVAGCTKNMIVNVDGMPISDHEYNLTNDETGIRIAFTLAEYYREYEGKEYILKPRYLDALQENEIDSETIKQLVLHIKVVNLKKSKYSLYWGLTEPDGRDALSLLYYGKLSRKDFYIKLPTGITGEYEYSFRLESGDDRDLFSLPQMRYKTKKGGEDSSTYGN